MQCIHLVFHASKLALYRGVAEYNLHLLLWIEDELGCVVAMALNKRALHVCRQHKTWCLIRWKGYGDEHNNWKLADGPIHYLESMQEYYNTYRSRPTLELRAPKRRQTQ